MTDIDPIQPPTLACIPLLFVWDDGETTEDSWYERSQSDDHGEALPEMDAHGSTPAQRYWLWHRRFKWHHEARVRG